MLTPAFYPSLERHDAASRTDDRSQLSDEQWFLIEDLFDWQPPTRSGGRPPIPPRAVLDALLWMLRNGGPWNNLPEYFPSESTCRRRLSQVDRDRNPGRSLVPARRTQRRTGMDRLGPTDRRRNLLSSEKRGDLVGVGRKGKGTTALVLMDNDRTPLGVVIAPANEHEVRHIERLLDASVVELPESFRLLYDGAADSDALRGRLLASAVDLICPHRKNPREAETAGRAKAPTQATPLACRTDKRLAAELRAHREPQGPPRVSLSRLGSTRLPVHYSQEVLTELLDFLWWVVLQAWVDTPFVGPEGK